MSSNHTLRHQRRNISGGELPPTPPTHSRTSSSSHSVNITTLSPLQTPAQSSENVQSSASPTTPPNQKNPPTPEVTPPRTALRPKAPSPRPALYDRIPSKCTTESRTESFRTALESPEVSDAEDSRSTLRPAARSARTSQITVRQINGDERKSHRGSGIWTGAESNTVNGSQNLTPNSKREFNTFDGEWCSGTEVEQKWDDNLMRNVTVRKRQPKEHLRRGKDHEALGDSEISPSNPSRAVRGLPLKGRVLTYEPAESSRRSFTTPEIGGTETFVSGGDLRRLSGMSAKSTTSTVVEAILVNGSPRRQKTLRHVRRVDALRDSLWQPSTLNPITILQENTVRRRPAANNREAVRGSFTSTSDTNSIASHKARRHVLKNGGIPVVVVPDRQSSHRSSSRDRSLRSSSSKRSDRRPSVASTPTSHVSKDYDLTPYFERPIRRGRTMSESDGSTPGDQRTIDYPPIVPRRTSSLSAPTSRSGSREGSRSGSRAGSLTAERLEALNASVASISAGNAPKHTDQVPSSSLAGASLPVVMVHSVPSHDLPKAGTTQGGSGEHHDKSSLGSPLLPAHATPFSQTSVETNGTAPEISEAMAVSISTHKNRSILMVDHRPSESSDGNRRSHGAEKTERPTITTTAADESRETEAGPITPPRAKPLYSLQNVDSPLRNPRAPPEPPVLQFSPATPSGLTPAEERPKLLGNFYEATEERPARGLKKVRRALGGRRHSSYGPPAGSESRPGFLTRAFSLGERTRRNASDSEPEHDDYVYPYESPIDETRLHPDWRPTFSGSYGDECMDGYGAEDEAAETMRYPPVDNRSRPPKRTLGERMKRTFAIMPLQDADDIYANDTEPERRTIKRTPSGNLRVVKHHGSEESLRERKSRPPNSAETRRRPFFRRSSSRSSSLGKSSYESGESDTDSQRTIRLGRTWSLTQSLPGISRRLSEKRREKRSNELRQKISGPRTVRDGVGEVIKHESLRDAFYQPENASFAARR